MIESSSWANNPINILERISEMSHPIHVSWKGYNSQLILSYCLLMKIPFVITDDSYLSYIPSVDPIIELTSDDIEHLDDNNRLTLINISYTHNIPHYRRMFNHPITHINIIGKLIRRVANMTPRILDNVRTDLANERVYTSPIFDKCWRKLSSIQIINEEFNPEHLQSIGVHIPDVNLIFNTHPINTRKLKSLLPYSNPCYNIIMTILNNLHDNQSLLQLILLIRYKRWLVIQVINDLKIRDQLDYNIRFAERICERSMSVV